MRVDGYANLIIGSYPLQPRHVRPGDGAVALDALVGVSQYD